MSDTQSAADEQAEAQAEAAAEAQPKQRVSRMPAEEEVGPFFPSGMSAPEAALAGATANLTEEQKERLGIEGDGEPEEEETP